VGLLTEFLTRWRQSSSTASIGAHATTLDAAIAKAAAFLRERLRSGAYGLACVGSDGAPRFSDNKGHVFVASFIAEAMNGVFDEIGRTIVLVRILSEEDNGLWGFSPPGPTIVMGSVSSMSTPTTRHT
jgi:hypothetical protein